ncbi:MAG: patatin-like phospholipase family protein [Polyangiales bacterium]
MREATGDVGIVLSGGGARGAYEVGALHYVFHDLVQKRGTAPKLSVIAGTSVGAVNATFLASTAEDFPARARSSRRPLDTPEARGRDELRLRQATACTACCSGEAARWASSTRRRS